jgi:hypothetical protein
MRALWMSIARAHCDSGTAIRENGSRQAKLRILFLLPIVLLAGRAWADPLPLTLTLSSPNDLSKLVAMDTAQIDVTLSNLDIASEGPLTFLSALVNLITNSGADPLLAISGVQGGEIIPSVLSDPSDFQTNFDLGDPSIPMPPEADATFLTGSVDSSQQISTNGIFFSFDIVANAPGTGSIQFDENSLIALSTDDPSFIIVHGEGDLTFTVSPAESGGAVTPLPSTLTAASGLFLTILVVRALRRRSIVHATRQTSK